MGTFELHNSRKKLVRGAGVISAEMSKRAVHVELKPEELRGQIQLCKSKKELNFGRLEMRHSNSVTVLYDVYL